MKQKRIKTASKNWLLSTNKGNIGDILGTSICLFFFIAIFILAVHFVRILDVKRTVDAKARQYLLILEEKGELDTTDLNDLATDFDNMGFHNYTVTYNDTNVKKQYGERVSIEIVVNASIEELGISHIFNLFADEMPFASRLESISKCGT